MELGTGAQLSQGTAIIQLAVDSIQNNDLDTLSDYLERMPIERLDEYQSASLLLRFLTATVEFQRREAVPIILEAWSDFFPEIEDISLYTLLYTMPLISVDILVFVSDALEDVGFLEVLDELIMMPAKEELILAGQRAHAVFGPQTRDTYLVAFQSAESRGNEAITTFLLPLLQATEEYVPIPEWVRNFTDGPIPREEDIVIDEPEHEDANILNISIDDAVNLLTEGLTTAGILPTDMKQAQEIIRAHLALAPASEKIAILQPVLEKRYLSSLQDDDYLFRILGPANPLFDSEVEQMSFGGCRMFTCAVFDYDDEDNDYFDWFTGHCEICRRKIRNRYHALRLPRPMGGWVGCFCSFEHVREGLGNEETQNSRPDIATRTMIDIVEREINRIGIQDRIVPGELLSNREQFNRSGENIGIPKLENDSRSESSDVQPLDPIDDISRVFGRAFTLDEVSENSEAIGGLMDQTTIKELSGTTLSEEPSIALSRPGSGIEPIVENIQST